MDSVFHQVYKEHGLCSQGISMMIMTHCCSWLMVRSLSLSLYNMKASFMVSSPI